MLSAKTFFLAVYTPERSILRVLFLPLCYTFLLSPFILLASRYYSVYQKLLQYIPNDYTTPEIWPQLFLAIITVSVATRFISSYNVSAEKDGGKRRVQLLPYWIPGVRHWFNIVFGGEEWLKAVR
jgi:hypothetical protein